MEGNVSRAILSISRLFFLSIIQMVCLSFGTASAADPVSLWQLDESSGTVANDLTGHGHNGTCSETEWSPAGGRFGGAALFTDPNVSTKATHDYISVPTAGMTAAAGTVALWVNPIGDVDSSYFFGHSSNPTNATNRLQIKTSLATAGANPLNIGMGGSGNMISGLPLMTPGQWAHIALTWQGSSGAGTAIVYVNGTQKGSGSYSSFSTLGTNAHIGNNGLTDTKNGARAYIDEVAVWSVALSASEVLDVYTNGLGPGKAANPNPAGGASNVAIDTDISWTAGSGTTSQDVYFGTANPPPFKVNQTAVTCDTGLMAFSTTYYWRIDGKTVTGSSVTGDLWSFTTSVPTPPGKATSPAPANSAVNVNRTGTTLSWTAGSSVASHDVYFGTVSSPPYVANLLVTSYPLPVLSYSTVYYWRIDERNSAGPTTGDLWSFTTAAPVPPGKATVPVPANSAANVGIVGTTLSWTAGSLTTSHDVYFGTVSTPPFKTNTASGNYQLPLLNYQTTYYWRIDEKNDVLTTTGDLWSFTTSAPVPPGKATGPSPANQAVEVAFSATLSWTAGSVVTSHKVYFGTDSTPDEGEYRGSTVDTTFVPQGYKWADLTTFAGRWLDSGCSSGDSWCGGADLDRSGKVDIRDFAFLAQNWSDGSDALKINTTYYWQINEVGPGGETSGDVWSFTTTTGKASGPNPANGATGASKVALVSWTAGYGAASHDVYFGTANPPPFKGNRLVASYYGGTLASNTVYYWRVNEISTYGTAVGDIWSFTTELPPDPTIIARWKFDESSGTVAYDSSGNSNDGTLNGSLGWSASGGSVSFDGSAGNFVGIQVPQMQASGGTLAVWFNLGINTGQRFLFGYGGNPDRIQLYMMDDILSLGLGTLHNRATMGAPVINVWHYVALTWNGSTYKYYVYVDGVQKATGTYAGLTTVAYAGDIGNNGVEHTQAYKGLIGDVSIWNRVLSASELSSIYGSGLPSRITKAAFTALPTSGSLPLAVTFTDKSSGDNLSGWLWDFGDGQTSTERNPRHVYDTQGVYTAMLVVSGTGGKDVATTNINVGPAQYAVADFSCPSQMGFVPLPAPFTDLSTGSVTSWSWDFGDGGTSTEQHPVHTYILPGTYTVTLTVAGPLNSSDKTRTNYITAKNPPSGGSGLAIVDSPLDLTNTHPHLWVRGYGPDNGLWGKAQTTHAEIWQRLISTAPTGSYPGPGRSSANDLMQAAMAFVISKNQPYGNHCKSAVTMLNGSSFTDDIGDLETLYAYAIAYDAIVDDPQTQWLTPSQKSIALATFASAANQLNLDPNDTWRVRPTHNLMVLKAAAHAACTYNLRGAVGYESLFETCRQYSLTYHMERVNGLCENSVLEREGPRPADGFPYEGINYAVYQAQRALIHRHILETNEYPNPATILDENKSGFFQNYNRAWLSLLVPGMAEFARVGEAGSHAVMHAIRYYSAINKAVGDGREAGVGEWFHQQILPSAIGGAQEQGWWQGWEFIWYDPSIVPLSPTDAGWPLYVHLDDSECHSYRTSWNVAAPSASDTYVYFRNSAHDGHVFWKERHAGYDASGESLAYHCQVQTSSHDGADNGHFGIYRNGMYLADNEQGQGSTDMHNCISIDGKGQIMDGKRGYEIPELAGTDVVGAVDSDYGHALDAIVGPAYGKPTLTDPNSYRRFMFVIRDPMYVLIADELETGHTITFRCSADSTAAKVAADLFTSSNARYELLYPVADSNSLDNRPDPITVTTRSPQLLFLAHANPSGVSVTKSISGGKTVATIGQDTVIYNPAGTSYTQGSISGNAKLFAQRTGGALIFKATTAAGSQYGISCGVPVNMSVKARKASIYVYGTGTHTVTVTSPYGTDSWSIEAGTTQSRTLSGRSIGKPVADFFAVPLTGWDIYCQPEFVSISTGWITDYLWEFGDSSFSTELAPHHKYTQAGLYTISLTVTGPGGTDKITKQQYINIKDFGDYPYQDYVLTEPTQAAFDAALDAIEATQIPYGTPPPWCGPNWCAYTQYGGGGRILFGFSDVTIETNWDSRIDTRNPTGNSDYKRDFFGDNLIIDGQNKNITFHYNGTGDCGQAENRGCMRIHGNDNIVKNIAWERFPDGIHMRGGERNLIEGLTIMTICEDATTMGGSQNSCRGCVLRDAVYGISADKTFMINTADESLIVIDNMHSVGGSQPIRISNGESPMLLVVRNSHFEGHSQGPRFGTPRALTIFENNYSSTENYGIRIGEQTSVIMRNNIFENCGLGGVQVYATGAYIRAENNIFRNNTVGGIVMDGCPGTVTDMNVDLGGGLVDVHSACGMTSGPGTEPAASIGQNTITGNTPIDLNNACAQVEKAENNFWDHTTVADILTNDVSGSFDVDPLGVDINN